MSKICLLAITFCAIVPLSRGRECYYLINQAKCQYKCCGEEGSMSCRDSCDNVDCSSDEDCGYNGCCSNGKCNDPRSDCDSSKYIPCNEDCSDECCSYKTGVCRTGHGCFRLNSNCSLHEACDSNCCHEGKCRNFDFCLPNEDSEEPIHEEHDEDEVSHSETNFSWKTPVIVIVIIIVVVVKVALLMSWCVRRSRNRVIVVRTVLAPTSTVQVNHGHDVSDTVPFLLQDQEKNG